MNKKILVIGATSDIGMEYIKHLNEQSKSGEACTVIAHYRAMNDDFIQLEKNCKGIKIDTFQADLLNEDELHGMIEEIVRVHQCITHILYLPASQFMYKRMTEFDSISILEEFRLQVVSLAELLSAFLPEMSKEKWGRVVVMLSACTIGVPTKYLMEYNVVKHALLGMVKSAAVEYGDQGITVNGISPSMVETKFWKKIEEKDKEAFAGTKLLHRNLVPEDINSTIDYLFAESSSFVNGVNINLSGGNTM